MDETLSGELRAALGPIVARVGELEEQLQRVRLRVSTLERTLSSVVEIDFPTFRQAVREAYDRLNHEHRAFLGVVPIPELRRALGPRLSRQAFDEHLVRLGEEGIVQLMPHPGSASEERLKEGILHPTLGAFYFVRWERQP